MCAYNCVQVYVSVLVCRCMCVLVSINVCVLVFTSVCVCACVYRFASNHVYTGVSLVCTGFTYEGHDFEHMNCGVSIIRSGELAVSLPQLVVAIFLFFGCSLAPKTANKPSYP